MKVSRWLLAVVLGSLSAFLVFFLMASFVLQPLVQIVPFSAQLSALTLVLCALAAAWLAAWLSRAEERGVWSVALGVGAAFAVLVVVYGLGSLQAGDPLSTGWQAVLLILAAAAVGGAWCVGRRWGIYASLALLALMAVLFVWHGPDAFWASDVEITAQDDVVLAGTLTVPVGPKDARWPAVVLVPDSGRQDRDEASGRNRPLKQLAEYLSAQGFVVLRYDKRGVGRSGGEFETTGLLRFADDARSAFEYLRDLPEVEEGPVFLLGHGYGGKAATIVAVTEPEAAGLVLLATVAQPEPDNLRRQQEDMLRYLDASAEEKEAQLAAFDAWMAGARDGQYQTYDDYFGEGGLQSPYREAQEANPIPPQWLREAMEYDQLKTLVLYGDQVPILVLSGASDWVVPPSETAQIEETLREIGHPDYTVKVLDGLDHRFSVVDSPEESLKMSVEPDNYYARNAYPIPDEVLRMILDWLQEHVGE